MDESDVKSAAVTNESKTPWVRQTLTDQGAQRLMEATRGNIGNRMAVVLNGRLLSAPVIQAAVSNGIPLTGPFTREQAGEIAAELNRQANRR